MVYMNFVGKRLFDATMARHAAEWYGISKAEGLALGNKGQVQKIAENLRALQRGLTGDRARVGLWLYGRKERTASLSNCINWACFFL
jgi:hypothetical protein